MNIIRALEALKELELKAAQLYESYNRLFQADREVSGFFYLMNLDEKSHADLIDYQIRVIKKSTSMFKDVEFDEKAIRDMIMEIDSKISAKSSVSVMDALKAGLFLENSALEHHYNSLIAKSNPEVGVLVKTLGAADKEHYEKLKELAVKKGVPVV